MSEEVKPAIAQFIGEYAKVLDDKRRVALPSKWRFEGDDNENTYLAIQATSYKAIIVMPPEKTALLREKISKISIANPNKRRALAKFLQNAQTFGCDKQGRIMLSESLLKWANITKEVCIAGNELDFEIWNPQLREEWLAQSTLEDDTALIEEFGI